MSVFCPVICQHFVYSLSAFCLSQYLQIAQHRGYIQIPKSASGDHAQETFPNDSYHNHCGHPDRSSDRTHK